MNQNEENPAVYVAVGSEHEYVPLRALGLGVFSHEALKASGPHGHLETKQTEQVS